MKIAIEELDIENSVIGLNDGKKSVSIVEGKSALDFHLAKTALRNLTEMLNRHLLITKKEREK